MIRNQRKLSTTAGAANYSLQRNARMPRTSAPSLTLAIDVPDYHSLAKRFEGFAVPHLTCSEAADLAALTIEVPADASPRAIEIAVSWQVAEVLAPRLTTAKALTGSLGDALVFDPRNRTYIHVGEFTLVEAQVEQVAA